MVPNESIFKDKQINSNYSQTSPIELSTSVTMSTASNQLLSVNCNVNSNDTTQPTSSPSPGVILGSTPLSQIGAHSLPVGSESNTIHGSYDYY